MQWPAVALDNYLRVDRPLNGKFAGYSEKRLPKIGRCYNGRRIREGEEKWRLSPQLDLAKGLAKVNFEEIGCGGLQPSERTLNSVLF